MAKSSKVVKSTIQNEEVEIPIEIWLAFCYFHHGDYEKALKVWD